MYDRNINGRELTFGFHPITFQDNLLLIDIETRSLWNQLERRAVEGEQTGTVWPVVPSVQTTWGHWRSLHPKTLVVLPGAGQQRMYSYAPNAPAAGEGGQRLGQFELVLGVEIAGATKAYPFSRLAGRDLPIEDRIGDEAVVVHFHAESPSAWAVDAEGDLLPGMTVYWRAWKRFHPETALFGEP